MISKLLFRYSYSLLLTLMTSNLVFLEIMGPLSFIVSTTSVAVFCSVIAIFAYGLKFSRHNLINILLTILSILIVISALFHPLEHNLLYSIKDIIMIYFVISMSMIDIKTEELYKIIRLSIYFVCALIVILTFYNIFYHLSYTEINDKIYADNVVNSIIDYASGIERERFTFPGINANTTALILVQLATFSLIISTQSTSSLEKLVFFVLSLIFLYFMFYTYSKTAIVLLLVCIGLLYYFNIIKFSHLLLIFASFLFILIMYDDFIIYRVIQISDVLFGTEYSSGVIGRTSDRTESITVSLGLIVDNPLGIGRSEYGRYLQSAVGGGEHNNYLYNMIIYGPIFGLFYIIIILWLFRSVIGVHSVIKHSSDVSLRHLSIIAIITTIVILLVQIVAPISTYVMVLLSLVVLIINSINRNTKI